MSPLDMRFDFVICVSPEFALVTVEGKARVMVVSFMIFEHFLLAIWTFLYRFHAVNLVA